MIVVNLYGGPGVGKSTGAAYVFARLKEAGVVAELVTEFAKDLTWGHSRAILDEVKDYKRDRETILNWVKGAK